MAETLGSLIDKLTIKAIREFHITKSLAGEKALTPKKEMQRKLAILKRQKISLQEEIEIFIIRAGQGLVCLRDEKLKLYNRPEQMGKIGNVTTLSQGIDALCRKNLELWALEDEARRTDKPLSYVGQVKRKIDLTNQQRNDLIDHLDELLEQAVKKPRRAKPARSI